MQGPCRIWPGGECGALVVRVCPADEGWKMSQIRAVWNALYELFADSGFSMAGAIAFSFVLSLFPFSIFLGAVAGYFGGAQLARSAVAQLFLVLPEPVAKAIEPEVMSVMGQSRFGLLTVGALIALFFATSAIESLRAALNLAYRVREYKSYPACLLQSMFLVLLSAVGMLAMAWGIIVGPQLAVKFRPTWLLWMADETWMNFAFRYVIVAATVSAQLLAYHLFLAAGSRRLPDVLPGVVLSVFGWIVLANIFSRWTQINDYSRFYAGLTQLMSALIFFQMAAIIVILGAEVNRALSEVRTRGRQQEAA
jgi:membrane protein